MQRLTYTTILLLAVVLALYSSTALVSSSLALPSPPHRARSSLHRRRWLVQLHGGGGGGGGAKETHTDNNKEELLQDHSGAASTLFGNLRIPAALFAGASAGAAFALPIADAANESVRLGMVKRLYALCMMGALSSQVIAIVVATVTMGSMVTSTEKQQPKTARSVAEYIRQYYDLEWVTARFHFLGGLLLFIFASGLRAWISIACPVVAKAALGIILSSTLLAMAFIDAVERTQFSTRGLVGLPLRYVQLLGQKIKRMEGPWFLVAAASAVVTMVYLGLNVAHVYKYLTISSQQ